LVAGTEVDVGAAEGRVSMRVTASSYGPVNHFDHPVVSLLAVGLASGLDGPGTTEVKAVDGGWGDLLVTCRRRVSDAS
jgi:hypothetical protein